MESFDLVCFGEILYDIYKKDKVLAGAPLNTASFASFLGLKTALISAIGNKKTDDQIENELKQRSIELFLQRNNFKTGEAIVNLNKNKIPTFSITPDSAFDHIKKTSLLTNLVAQTNFFYYGSLSQRNEDSKNTLIELLSLTNAKKVYDVNFRSGISFWQKILKKSLIFPFILKMNTKEATKVKKITNCSKLEHLFEKTNISNIFITLGKKGAFLYQRNQDPIFRNAPKINVVDTTGCGDAFTAASIYGFHKKWEEKKILDFSVNFSSIVAQYKGAFNHDFLSKEVSKLV